MSRMKAWSTSIGMQLTGDPIYHGETRMKPVLTVLMLGAAVPMAAMAQRPAEVAKSVDANASIAALRSNWQ
mgnify:CR=1 FL=1